jgi:thiamine transport system substrate-binding protein
MAHDSFAVSDEVLEAFEQEHDVEVEIRLAGDAGTMLNSAILAKGAPLADVLYGVDNTYLSRALAEAIFEPYESPALAVIPDEFELDPAHGALPVDWGDVCINYEIAYFEDNDLPVPGSLEDLLQPEYAGLLTVQNPATSSPGLAFLLATIGHFGTDGYLDYWAGLVENEVSVVNDWETAYYTEFSRWGGPDPLVVSYGSSPPFEVIFAEEPIDSPPTGVITAGGTCFRQIEFAGILAGTENRELAEAWIDYMLSVPFQEDIPLNMFVFPVNPDAELQAEFVEYLAIPENPVRLDPSEIADNRAAWLQAWTETVLR